MNLLIRVTDTCAKLRSYTVVCIQYGSTKL